ncbi:MAG: ribbon-helix-helix protein, CopG family [Gemmatimonadales bacterium]
MSIVTVRLDKKLERELSRAAKRAGRPKSELIREALRRQLAASRFEELRQSAAPFAEARGWLTDEDVFRDIS